MKNDHLDRAKRREMVMGATPDSHRWLGYDWYSTDGTSVINNEAATCILEEADPFSFHVFPRLRLKGFSMRSSGQYAIDDCHVYFDKQMLKTVDAKSFRRLGTSGYARDAKQFLFMGNPLSPQPTEPVKVKGLVLIGADKVHLAGRVVAGLDPESFELVDTFGRFRDKSGEYQLQIPERFAGWSDALLVPVRSTPQTTQDEPLVELIARWKVGLDPRLSEQARERISRDRVSTVQNVQKACRQSLSQVSTSKLPNKLKDIARAANVDEFELTCAVLRHGVHAALGNIITTFPDRLLEATRTLGSTTLLVQDVPLGDALCNVLREREDLTELVLEGCGLRQPADDLFEYMHNLTQLDLSFNKLQSIPKLASLSKLQSLHIVLTCQPPEFPDMSKLRNLKEVYIGSHRVFPEQLCSIASLEVLNVVGGRMSSLPETLGNLGALKHLDACYGKLETLPDRIGELRNLERIHLHGNPITSLPESLHSLMNLKRLTLSGEGISNARLTELRRALPHCSIEAER